MLRASVHRGSSRLTAAALARPAPAVGGVRRLTDRIPENEEQSTGMEKKEEIQTPDIFWSREPITGHKGTKDNPAIVPSYNESRVVGLETHSGVIWFRLVKGPLHLVCGQYFKLNQIEGGDH